jgi:membrane-associated phospholipid phosphatase
MINRRLFVASSATAIGMRNAAQASEKLSTTHVLFGWYDLTLELVRHTATYTPPVAARAFAYLGLIAFEATASGSKSMVSLAGQLPTLQSVPRRKSGGQYDETVILHAALAKAVELFFDNTGPSGKRALASRDKKFSEQLRRPLDASVFAGSLAFGTAMAEYIFEWSKTDGGHNIDLMGFGSDYKVDGAAGHWQPTSAIRLQQMPLLPNWGGNRTFAIPNAATCALPAPPSYNEDKSSAFYKEALEVYDVARALTPEQKLIARFWSDDPMLSPTPPGHWIYIALDILKTKSASIEDSVDLLARLGMAVADAFVACWKSKYDYDLLRPITYIKKNIDKAWEPLLITPPFPEYPSGHSTQSGAAAMVLTRAFGDNFAFEDKTHVREKFKGRAFKSFWEAANEAGISRLYGGIHFRAAVEQGLEQGRCVGAAVNALKTRVAA